MGLDIIVINLDFRQDRWSETVSELEKAGITDYQRFSAIVSHSGERGCALSHHAVLKQDFNHSILIFEDDIHLSDNWSDIFLKAIKQLPSDFDILYLGANVKTPAIKYSENLYMITGGVHCTHAMLYSAKGRRKMIELWDPDNKEFNQIDHWLFMRGQALLNCFVCSPLIAWQRPSYSDIRLTDFDYRAEMEENAKINMA
jgi:GR25 family glycosyltransferase involved in LPS biosynthesis